MRKRGETCWSFSQFFSVFVFFFYFLYFGHSGRWSLDVISMPSSPLPAGPAVHVERAQVGTVAYLIIPPKDLLLTPLSVGASP